MLSATLLRHAKRTLREGGVIAYATESCYGLGCDPCNFLALKKIIRLKGRRNSKGMIVVAAKFAQLSCLIKPLSIEDKSRLRLYWPGPNTLLLNASKNILPLLRGRQRQKIALRITAQASTKDLCNQLGMALVSTSANFSKKKSLKSAIACRRQFGAKVLVLPGRIGKRKSPSNIIDFASGRKLR